MCKKTFYSFVSHTVSWNCVKPMALNILFGLKCPIWSPFLIFIIHLRLFVSIYAMCLVYVHCCLDFGLFQKPKKLLDRSMVSTSTTPPPIPMAPPKRSPVNPLTQGPFHSWLTRLNRFQRQMWCFSVSMWQKILLSSCIVKAESGKTEERVSNL